MIKHVVMFRLKPGVTPEQRAAAVERLRALPGQIDTVRGYDVGEDLGLVGETYDLGVVGEFEDIAGFEAYQAHPAHEAVLQDVIVPILQERARMQFEA